MAGAFNLAEFTIALEASLGFGLVELTRLPGRAHSLNFLAKPVEGERFVVKCARQPDNGMFARLARHVDELAGSKAVRRVHPQALRTFGAHAVLCLSLCEGERRMPDQLSAEELRGFLDDYLRFSRALQRASYVLPVLSPEKNLRHVQDWFRGCLAHRLKTAILREMDSDDLVYRKTMVKVIHGDFHHGNFLFKDGVLSGIFDLEEFRYGYPTEDIVRYFVCAYEHVRWYAWQRKRAIVSAFGEAVRQLPYGRHEWMLAINGLQLRMMESRVERGYGPFGTPDLWRKGRLYDTLRRIVRERFPG